MDLIRTIDICVKNTNFYQIRFIFPTIYRLNIYIRLCLEYKTIKYQNIIFSGSNFPF